jgi:hypothetical protein
MECHVNRGLWGHDVNSHELSNVVTQSGSTTIERQRDSVKFTVKYSRKELPDFLLARAPEIEMQVRSSNFRSSFPHIWRIEFPIPIPTRV